LIFVKGDRQLVDSNSLIVENYTLKKRSPPPISSPQKAIAVFPFTSQKRSPIKEKFVTHKERSPFTNSIKSDAKTEQIQ
jgi:hypothetical protein